MLIGIKIAKSYQKRNINKGEKGAEKEPPNHHLPERERKKAMYDSSVVKSESEEERWKER